MAPAASDFRMYCSTDPLTTALWACAAFSLACWLLSIATRDYSWVDRLWSLLPPLYTVHFAVHAGLSDVRLNLMAALTVAWGARLTYNFWRKGGYRPGGEDYRWVEVQRLLGPIGFQLFNATFIAPLQNLLLLALTFPAYIAYVARDPPLTALDYAAALLFVLLLAGETVADQQQWRFQTVKHARKRAGEPVEREFLTHGLFRYSRHPNFFCEQGMWWSFYLFAVAATGDWLDSSIVGAASLTLLFQGSTALTEQLTLRKYPDYADYQRTTSRLVPMPPRGGEYTAPPPLKRRKVGFRRGED